MEGLVRFATRAGVLAVGAGIVSELCLYDGTLLPCLPSVPDSLFIFPSPLYSPLTWDPLVDGGRRAVIFDKIRGIQSEVVSEGTHFRIPLIQVPSAPSSASALTSLTNQ